MANSLLGSGNILSQTSSVGTMITLNSGGGVTGGNTPSQQTIPDEAQIQSSLPLPPQPYVQMFSDENVKRGRAPKPPPPPASHETYMVFGVTYHADDAIIRPLESQGIRRLYPQNFDHRRELKKMNHSVLVNFLDLLDILIHCPDAPKRQEKIDDIQLLFIHMHHLINEFRPHQARETLRVMMEVQKRQTLETCDRFQKHLEMSVEIIKSALNNLPDQLETDSKFLSMTETFFSRSKPVVKELTVSSQDQMMCDIADSL